MDWERWRRIVQCANVSSAFIFLSAYIMAMFDFDQFPEGKEVGLVYMQDGCLTCFYAVDLSDMTARLDIPVIQVENVNPKDPQLKSFTFVKMGKRGTN